MNLANSQRYTQPLFGDIPRLHLPTSHGLNYEVTEDGKDSRRETIGDQLRFGLNQRLGHPRAFISDDSFQKFSDRFRNTRPVLGGFDFPVRRHNTQFPIDSRQEERQSRYLTPQEPIYHQNQERNQEESRLIYSPSYRHVNHGVDRPLSQGFTYRNTQPFFKSAYQPEYYGFQGLNQGYYDRGNQKSGGSEYNHAAGQQGVEASSGEKKIDEGIQYLKQDQGDSGLYSNLESKKQAFEDSKKYGGSKLLNKEG